MENKDILLDKIMLEIKALNESNIRLKTVCDLQSSLIRKVLREVPGATGDFMINLITTVVTEFIKEI